MSDALTKLLGGGAAKSSKVPSVASSKTSSKKNRAGSKVTAPKLDETLSQRLSKIGKHKKKHKHGPTALSYTILPKGKRLARKVVEKLEREKYHFVLARALDAARRLKQTKKLGKVEDDDDEDDEEEVEESDEEEAIKFKVAERHTPEYKHWKHNKMHRIATREKKRRKRRELRIKEELRRKKYRIHPGDLYHMYLEGYQRKRHRITKKRFMRCVDVVLLKAVMDKNQELMSSELWDDELNISDLSYVRARILKNHLQQFEVLEEALKQGIFNHHGVDDLPIQNIKRKRKPATSLRIIPDKNKIAESKKSDSANKKATDDKKNPKTRKSENLSTLPIHQRRLTYPPFTNDWNEHEDHTHTTVVESTGGWLSKVSCWITTKSIGEANKVSPVPPSENVEDENGDVVSPNEEIDDTLESAQDDLENDQKRASTAKETEKKSADVEINVEPDSVTPKRPSDKPFSDYLTIKVPLNLGEKKKFIYNLVKRRIKDSKNLKNPEWLNKMKEKKPTTTNRFDKKYDPMDRLHEDEKESDVWTISTTTTTDGYASWRRPPAVNKSVDETEDWSETDKTFLWRIVLFLIVLWELYGFLDKRLDDVYYSTLTYHLYRENIWPVRPHVFPEVEIYSEYVIQEWLHFIISLISLPIIHKENECLSLLFAFSMLLDGFAKVAKTSHDALFLPHEASMRTLLLYFVHLIWKAIIICSFVAYHYYSVDYIRKEREFDHRKVRLHNHEIMAKGTKGLQKRKVAWDWMVRHARNTNLRALKKKYPDVKDGNFPDKDLDKHIRFDEAKELRIYAQEHNLNIGYPYNKLRDMKRYVFGELESSEYSSSEMDDKKNRVTAAKVNTRQGRQSVNALNVERFEKFKEEATIKQNVEKLRKAAEAREMTSISAPKSGLKRKAGNVAVGHEYNSGIGRTSRIASDVQILD